MNSNSISIGSYNGWKSWVNSLSGEFRIFIYYILFLPLINLTWSYSVPIVSFTLPEIFTGLSLVLVLFTKLKGRSATISDDFTKYFNFFGIVILFNFVFLFLKSFSVSSIDLGLKYLLAISFYYMFKTFIKNDNDFLMVAQTYVVSFFFIIISFFYFGDSAGRLSRGLTRFTSGYYDVTNVSLPAVYSFIFIFFLYLCSKTSKSSFFWSSTYKVSFLQLLIFYIIFNTFHISSYVIVTLLLILFFPFLLKNDKRLFILLIFGVFYFNPLNYFSEVIEILLRTDIEIIKTGENTERALHGRLSVWDNVLYEFNHMNFFNKLFGFTGSSYSGSGAHSDFIRIFMMSGIFGLVIYVIILIKILIKSLLNSDYKIKVLGLSVVISTLLYSVITMPTFYPFSCIPLFSVLAYLPLKFKQTNI
jgi:hypothetical protein